MTARSVTVLGLGRIGAPLAACLASRGFVVTGVDADAAKVDAFAGGRAPVAEPGLDDLMRSVRASVRGASSVAEAVTSSAITFVALPTPPTPDGSLSAEVVRSACTELGEALRGLEHRHVVAIVSTLRPGTLRGVLEPALRSAARRSAEDGLGICFTPEFVALGTAIRDCLEPDLVVVGEGDPASGALVAEVLGQMTRNDAPVVRTTPENAELAKLAINAYLATKITFANVLGEVSDALPHADADTVTELVGMDTRIGPRFLRAGPSFGGPCFPRDTAALATFARDAGAPAALWEATNAVNAELLDRLYGRVRARLPSGGAVAVCGLAFKPGTDAVEFSPGATLARRLVDDGIRVVGFDPLVTDLDGIEIADTLERAVDTADVVVVANPEPGFSEVGRLAAGRPVIDPWRIAR